MKCPNCGNEAQADAVFCDQCGTRLAAPVAPQTAIAPEPAVAAEPEPMALPTPSTPELIAAPPTPPVAEPAPAVANAAGAVCPGCGASNTPGELFCSECGTPLSAPQPTGDATTPAATPAPEPTKCPVCGADTTPGDTFCFACGAQLGQGLAATPAKPAQPAAGASGAGAASTRECPACGAAVAASDTFCEFCGAALFTPPATPTAPAPITSAPVPAAPAPMVTPARLVVAESGIELPLPDGAEIVVGREDPYTNVYPDIDLTPHRGEEGGVSRRHLRLRRVGQGFTIEDLNSTNFTIVDQVRLEPGKAVALVNGAEVRAGRVKLLFKVGA